MERTVYTIDAANQPLGRLACEIVLRLRGKYKPDFAPNKDEGDFVVIKNIGQMRVTGKKFKNKLYYRSTTRPGSIKKETMAEVAAKKGMNEVLRRAVYGMLPTNRLRAKMIKRLTFE